MMTLFVKVPCILVATVGLHISFTPPNTSAKNEHQATADQGILGRILQVGLRIIVAIKVCRFPYRVDRRRVR